MTRPTPKPAAEAEQLAAAIAAASTEEELVELRLPVTECDGHVGHLANVWAARRRELRRGHREEART